MLIYRKRLFRPPRLNTRPLAAVLLLLMFLALAGCQGAPPLPKTMAPSGESLTGAEPPQVEMIPSTFADVASYASPAVLNLQAVKKIQRRGRHSDLWEEFFRRFFGQQGQPPERMQSALGSGFLIDPTGIAITNYHVIEGADAIRAKLSDGSVYQARVLGRDTRTDLALIKIDAPKHLPYLKMGDSDKVRVGDWVVAIGNPFGLEHTVTSGILSARGRAIGAGPYDNYLQTNASINPGNSGGPLLNLKGEVIGINTAIVAQGQGIGFAIPSNLASQVVAELRRKGPGPVAQGWLGVEIQPVTPDIAQYFGLSDMDGAVVIAVDQGSPAQRAGLKPGDVIVSFAGSHITQADQLPPLVADAKVGSTVKLDYVRKGRNNSVTVRIGEQKF